MAAIFFMARNAHEVLTAQMEVNKNLAMNILASTNTNLQTQQSYINNLDDKLMLAINSVNAASYTDAWFESPSGEILIGGKNKHGHLHTGESFVPNWFVALAQPEGMTFKTLISKGGTDYGYFFIAIDTSYEVIELWHHISTIFWVGHVFFILIISLVYIVLYHGLNPLKRLDDALGELEKGNFSVRVENAVVPELRPINARFNYMATVLEKTVTENLALTEKMVTVQETERRDLARELHDDVSPCLFGIQVDLVGINKIAKAHQLDEVATRAASIKSITSDMQILIRKILHRLRPIALDDLGLCDSLQDMLENWQRKQPNIDWEWNFSGDYNDLADTVQITVYRIIQECTTNSVRHASASHIKINLKREDQGIHIIVTDDGKGISSDDVHGFGLIGMRDRVYALRGSIAFDSEEDKGVQVRVFIPLKKGGLTDGRSSNNFSD